MIIVQLECAVMGSQQYRSVGLLLETPDTLGLVSFLESVTRRHMTANH